MSKRAASGGSISPPPLRRKLNTATSSPKPSTTTLKKSSGVSDQHIRIYSWNVNGINAFIQKPITSFFGTAKSTSSEPAPTYSLRCILKRHQWPQLFCLQEVKIKPKDEVTKRALERAANANDPKSAGEDQGPGYTIRFCLPRDKYNAKGFGGKIYGVATLIRDDFLATHVSLSREVQWDKEGRFLVHELVGNVVIINGYWVNGTSNPYRNSITGLEDGTRHDRKREVHRLMLAECLAYERKGWHVILVGDMNIARCELDGWPGIRLDYSHVVNRGNFNTAFFTAGNGMQAIDAYRHLYGDKRQYTYYGRGAPWGESCDRVDMVILSKKLVDEGRLIDAEIFNTPLERGHSDHVPLSVTLKLSDTSVVTRESDSDASKTEPLSKCSERPRQ